MKLKGQSLIEIVLAVALLAFVMVTAVGLAITTIRANAEAGRRTQASQLATKELEALRTYRDVNAKQKLAWSSYMPPLNSATDCTTFTMDQVGAQWTYTAHTEPQYFSNSLDPSYDAATGRGNYRRLVTMCESRDFVSGGAGLLPSDNVRSVEVRVEWDEATGVERQLTLNTLLANWQQ